MESYLKQKLSDDLRQSMRERNETRTMTLRLLLSAIKYAEMNALDKFIVKQKLLEGVGEFDEVKQVKPVEFTDADILGIIAKEIKQREDSIAAFKQGNRQDLVDKETAEMVILKAYLPEQLSREQIAAEVQKTIAEVGARGPSDKGKVMGKIVAQLKGKADGKIINEIVTEILSKM